MREPLSPRVFDLCQKFGVVPEETIWTGTQMLDQVREKFPHKQTRRTPTSRDLAIDRYANCLNQEIDLWRDPKRI